MEFFSGFVLGLIVGVVGLALVGVGLLVVGALKFLGNRPLGG